MISKVIYIGGVARSGTSWLGQVFNSSPKVKFQFQPLFSYEFKGKVNEDSNEVEYRKFYQDLFLINSDFLSQKDKILKGTYPLFQKNKQNVLVFKENRYQSIIEPMLRKSDDLNFVGIIRNPCATILSWTKSKSEFPEGSELFKEWRFANCKNNGNEDYFGYYKWKEVANLYLDLKLKYPSRVQVIHYDEFILNSLENSKILFNQLNLDFTSQTEEFINASNKNEVVNDYYSVYKGSSSRDKWKTELPKYIIEEIHSDLKNTRLERFLK